MRLGTLAIATGLVRSLTTTEAGKLTLLPQRADSAAAALYVQENNSPRNSLQRDKKGSGPTYNAGQFPFVGCKPTPGE
jgi:hypothetical protein